MKKIFNAFILLTAMGILVFPSQSAAAAKEGIELCLNAVIPSLFPFMVISCAMINSGTLNTLSNLLAFLMKPLFNVNKNCTSTFILGLISGYPIGAKSAVSLYQNNLCSKTEGERLLTFCNNTSPAFILITVGVGIYKSISVGIMLLFAQIISALVTGIVFGKLWKGKEKSFKNYRIQSSSFQNMPEAFIDAVKSSSLSMLYICAFVVFFCVFINLLIYCNIIKILTDFLSSAGLGLIFEKENISQLIVGFFEITSGVKRSGAGNFSLAVTGAILGWAGLSVHCQIITFIQDSPFSPRPYILGKLFQGISAGVITYFFALIYPFEKQVFLNLSLESKAALFSGIKLLNIVFILSLIFIFFNKIKKRYLLYKKNDV